MKFGPGRSHSEADDAVRAQSSEEQLPFFEQLAGFFRRNALYFLIAGLILLIAQDIFGKHGVLAMRQTQVQLQEIRSDIKKLDDENKKLQQDATDLKSDPATIEGQARANGLARPGEVVFRYQAKSTDSPATPQPIAAPPKN
jgi:cell division protein FtsB